MQKRSVAQFGPQFLSGCPEACPTGSQKAVREEAHTQVFTANAVDASHSNDVVTTRENEQESQTTTITCNPFLRIFSQHPKLLDPYPFAAL